MQQRNPLVIMWLRNFWIIINATYYAYYLILTGPASGQDFWRPRCSVSHVPLGGQEKETPSPAAKEVEACPTHQFVQWGLPSSGYAKMCGLEPRSSGWWWRAAPFSQWGAGSWCHWCGALHCFLLPGSRSSWSPGLLWKERIMETRQIWQCQ